MIVPSPDETAISVVTAEVSKVFCTEDGGSRLLQNVGNNLPDYTASHPKTQVFIVTTVETSNPT
jgi:hypothetical protein